MSYDQWKTTEPPPDQEDDLLNRSWEMEQNLISIASEMKGKVEKALHSAYFPSSRSYQETLENLMRLQLSSFNHGRWMSFLPELEWRHFAS